MARRRDKRGRYLKGGGGTRRRRRSYRRKNPNPPRAHYRRRKRGRGIMYRRRHAARRRRRNPGISTRKLSGLIPPFKRIAAGVAGAAATRLIPNLIAKQFPQLPTSGAGGLAVKAAGAVLGGLILGKILGKQIGDDVALGGLIVVADEAARTWAPQIGIPMEAYLDPGMNAYLSPDDMGAYLAPGATVPSLPEDLSGDYDDLSGAGAPDRLDADSRL